MFGKKVTLGIDIQKDIIRYCLQRKGQWIYGEKTTTGRFFKDNKISNKKELINIFLEIFSELHIRKANIVISAPNSKLLIRQIPLNDMATEQEIREYLFFELGGSISLPFEDPVFDLLILERPPQKKERGTHNRKQKNGVNEVKVKTIKRNRFAVNGKVPVIITSEKLLDDIGETIAQSGGRLSAVDFSALAYTRALRRAIHWGECFALVEIDYGEATITIFKEFVPVYVQYEVYNHGNWRYQEIEGQIVPQHRGEQGALEDLATLLQRAIHYFETEVSENSKIAHIYLVGAHPNLKKDVKEIIQSQSEIPVIVPQSPYVQKNQVLLPHRFLLAASLSDKEI